MADLDFLSIDITNFKGLTGHHDLSLARKPGLYFVGGDNRADPALGPNGVGKSTLWDALLWCLWGRTGRDNKPGAAISPWGKPKASTTVSAAFRRAGQVYKVTRTRNPNHLFAGPVGEDEKEVEQSYVVSLLGMPEELFRRAVVLPQFGTMFLDLAPAAQAEMFTAALNLDIWLEAADNASGAAKIHARNIATYERELSAAKALVKELSGQAHDAEAHAKAFDYNLDLQITAVMYDLDKVQKQIARAENQLGDKPSLPKTDKKIVELADSINSEHSRLEDELLAIGKKYRVRLCKECRQPLPLTELEKARADAQQRSREQVALWQAELKEWQSKRAARDREYQKVLDEWQAHERKVVSLKADARSLERDIDRLKKTTNTALFDYKSLCGKVTAQKSIAGKLEQSISDAQTTQGQAEYWTKAFREIRLGIIDEVLVELEIAACRHAELLGLVGWQIAFRTERESKSGNVSYSFSVWITPSSEKEAVKWESYSGGESQRLQLATTFALSEVLLSRAGIDPSMEVYDEPTRGLSPEGIGDLLEHLADRADETGRVIWLVDHHSLDRGAFSGVLMVTKTDKGSTLQWV